MATAPPLARSTRVRITATFLLVVLCAALLAVSSQGPLAVLLPLIITAAAGTVTIWAVIQTRKHQRAHEEQLISWAAEEAAQTERLRVARELHDIVSHGLGAITVHAAAVSRAESAADTQCGRTLAEIERISRETTVELRRMLSVLRQLDEEAPPLHPAETLEDLPRIVENISNSTGLSATCDVGDLDEASPGAQATLCAVVREALTNTARHAGPTTVQVDVRRTGEDLVVRVQDAGPAPGWEPQIGAGHGLRGLHERVTSLNGTLHVKSQEPGFELMAHIPDRRSL